MANTSGEEIINSDFYDWAGIDHVSSPFLVAPNKLVQSQNFTSLTSQQTGFVGAKITREPYSLFLDKIDSNSVRNLIYFISQNTTTGVSTGYIMRISGANFYTYKVGGVATSWGTALTGFTPTDTTTPFGYATFNNQLHLSNGTDEYQTWTPSGFVAALSSAPLAKFLYPFGNRIYATNINTDPSAIYYSTVNYQPIISSTLASAISATGTSVTTTDSIFVGASSSYEINATIGYGLSTQENIKISMQTGTGSPYTITLVSGVANNHSAGEIIYNNDPWYSDSTYLASAGNFYSAVSYNGNVTALDALGGQLLIHKSNGAIYMSNGLFAQNNPLSANNPVFNAPNVSSSSPFAIQQISGIELFIDRTNAYAYTGGYPNPIGNEITDYIYNMTGSQYAIAPAIAFKNKYYIAIGTTKDKYGNSVTNAVLVYDFILNIWDIYSLHDMPVSWCVYVDNNGNEQLLFGDSAGNVYQWNTGTGDNSNPMTAILQTQYLTWNAPDKSKDIISYTYSTNPGANFLLQYSLDWSGKWTTFNNVSGFGVSSTAPASMRNFKSIAFRVISNSTNPMTFYGMSLKVNVGSRRNTGRVL